MDRMIVTIFNDERSAYEGMKAFRQLHAEGSLTLYAAAVIAKDAQGQVNVKQADDEMTRVRWGPSSDFSQAV